MKKAHFICLSVLCTVFLLLGTVFACTVAADAETAYTIDPEMPKMFWVGMREMPLTLKDNNGGKADITDIKPGDPGVFIIIRDEYLNEKGVACCNVSIKPVKAGITTMTISYIDVSGAARELTNTFSVKNYPNEIKKLTVNGHVIKTAKKAVKPDGKKADTRFGYTVRTRGTCERIRIKLKKGWKISSVNSDLSRGNGDDIRSYKEVTKKSITKKTVSRGSKIYFPKNWDDLFVTVTMKNKAGDSIDYRICFTR